MINYFANLPPDDAVQMEQLSRLSYELRESRRKLLEPYGVNDEGDLLVRIATADLPEHPAYEHYLGSLALATAKQDVTAELKALLARMGG
ncbi:hypothetical protein [Ralstonia sp.]|uniref:hypothetical protein n=1 Tax=Ralstonia sp. TaxID=54061 RepID=UPI002BF86DB1|nr:hypothetical protein [Ralstonia sp.]HWV05831.1 hypothetical protein [Ralstonia sp.]